MAIGTAADRTNGNKGSVTWLPDHPSYPNPLLNEVVCEFLFKSDNFPSTAPGDFFKAVQSEYPHFEPVTEQVVELIVGAEGVPLQRLSTTRVRFRLRHADKPFLVIVGDGQVSFSALEPYSGWKLFKEQIASVWPRFLEVASPSTLKRIGLRYINKFPNEAGTSIPARKWLRESDYVARALLDSEPPCMSRNEVQTDNEHRQILTIAHDMSPDSPGLLFDIDCIWQGTSAATWTAIEPELESLHEQAWSIFESSKSDDLSTLLSRSA